MSAFTNLELNSFKTTTEAADLNWTVSKRKLFTRNHTKNTFNTVEGQYALVRDDTDDMISVVSERYRPVQNQQIVDFFEHFAEESKGIITHGGHFKNKDIALFAKLDLKAFSGDDEEHQFYLLARSGHYPGSALQILLSTVRTVCTNQFNVIDAGSKGFFYAWHNVEFNKDTQQIAKDTLTNARAFIETFQDNLRFLMAKPVNNQKAHDLIAEQFPAEGLLKAPPRIATRILDTFQATPIGHQARHDGTAYKLWNAATEALDHNTRGRGRSALIGAGQIVKHQFFQKLLEAA